MRQLTSATLSNQNIATALLAATYTADADRNIFFRLFLDQVAGNGNYTAYITIRRLGAGSYYQVIPITTAAVAAGVTAVAFTTIPLPVKNTDVVNVYVLGLGGDTTTPDIITEVWDDCLPSAAAGAASGIPLMPATGNLKVDLDTLKTQAITCAAGVTVLASVGTATENAVQSGNVFTLIGALGAGLTALAPSATALTNATWSDARAILIDTLAGLMEASDIVTAIQDVGTYLKALYDLRPAYTPSVASSGKVAATVATGDDVDAAYVKQGFATV